MKKEDDNFLFNIMSEGVALHHYVRDDKGKIINYIIDDVNPVFEDILKIKKSDVIGKIATEAYQVKEAPYLEEYSSLIKKNKLRFETHFQPFDKYFMISAFSYGEDGFATIFFNISDLKKMEQDLEKSNEKLKKINKMMIDRELKMIELKNEINKQKK